MNDKQKLIENVEVLKKGIKLLGRNRKTVLPHHKAFELVDDLEIRIQEISEILKSESN